MLDKKTETYKLLVEKLYDKCQRIQVENERCVLRINGIKKLSRCRSRDVELLKRHLDKHEDNWRTLPMVAPHPKRKIEQKRGPKPKNKQNFSKQESIAMNKEKKVRKQRVKKYPANNQANQQQLLALHSQEFAVQHIHPLNEKQGKFLQHEQIMLLPQKES